MKMSISLPDKMALEIKAAAKATDRPISWYIQKAWDIARGQVLLSESEAERKRKKALKKLHSIQGALKGAFGDIDSVTLSKKAFLLK